MAYSTEQMAQHKDTICERIANGESLRTICSDKGMPDKATVFRWLSDDEAFRDQYARARESQADTIFDEILSIADTPMIGEKRKLDKEGNLIEVTTGDMIEHRRLQVDARKWMAGKLRPKKYGDKLEVDNNHNVSDPLASLLERIAGSGNRLVGSIGLLENADPSSSGEHDIAQEDE